MPFLWTGDSRRDYGKCSGDVYHALKYDEQHIRLSMHINVLDDFQTAYAVHRSSMMSAKLVLTQYTASDGAVLGLFSWSDQNLIENLFVNVMDPHRCRWLGGG